MDTSNDLINIEAVDLLQHDLNELAKRGLLMVWDKKTIILHTIVSVCRNGRSSIQLNVGELDFAAFPEYAKTHLYPPGKTSQDYFTSLWERTGTAAHHNLLRLWGAPPRVSELLDVRGAVGNSGQCVQINIYEEPYP